MTQRPPPSLHRKQFTSLQLLGAGFAVVAGVVVCAILFAPRKPPAPPPSAISYQEKPQKDTSPDDGDPAQSSASTGRRKPKSAELTPAAGAQEQAAYVILGTVTDAKTGKAIPKAVVACSSVAELEKEQEKAKESQPDPNRNRPRRGRRGEASPSALPPMGIQGNVQPLKHQIATDEEGKYALRVPDLGEYRFQVRATGYVQISDKTGVLEAALGELRQDFALLRGASVSGRVTESGTSIGAPRVRVVADGPGPNSTTTQDDGRYSVSGLLPGNYTIRLDLSKAPYLASGMAPARNVAIQSETQQVAGVDFTVDVAGEVWGYVLSRESTPIAGAEVFLCTSASMMTQLAEASLKREQLQRAQANPEGYYELIGVPLNKEWRLYAMTKERAPQLTAPFVLTPSQRSARIDVYVSPGTTVTGRVVSTDHSPVPKADVICIPSYNKFFSAFDSPQAFRNVTSNDDGTFEIPHLPVGEYQVIAQKRGFKFAAVGEPIDPDGYSDIHNLEVVLTPVEGGQGRVFGTVTDSSGLPIDGVHLTLGSFGADDLGGGQMTADTDGDGRYSFDGVQSGFQMLRAEKPGYQGQNVGNVRLDEATDFVMQAAGLVRGTVLVRESGAAVPQFSVRAVRTAGGAIGVGSVMDASLGRSFNTPDGSFEMELPAGEYLLEARATGLTPGRTPISISAGQEMDGVAIYLRQSGGRIEGRVVTADGKSGQGALVWLGQGALLPGMGGDLSGAPQNGVQAAADGSFEFMSLPAGTYTVRAKLEGYAQGQGAPVTLAEGQTLSGIEVVLGLGNALEGYVAFNGRLEPGAIVAVLGNGLSEITTSDANGQYRFDRLPAGTYMASAISLAGGLLSALTNSLHGRVEIIENRTTTYNFGEPTNTAVVGSLTPPPSGGIAVAVLHFPGGPMGAADLNFANPANWMRDPTELINYVVGLAFIGRDGFFRIDNLAAGDYVLEVFSANAGRIYSGAIAVPDNQITQADIKVPQ